MSTMIKDKAAFVETDCTIKHDGHEFTSGGSWLGKNKLTGKYEGILYASPKTNEVTSWDGSLRIPARYGRVFNSNWYNVRRQYCWFKYEGMSFTGINYSVDNQECITVRQTNS